jgi:hypothetical protein
MQTLPTRLIGRTFPPVFQVEEDFALRPAGPNRDPTPPASIAIP